ncbi:DUF3325 domain-containing protein [Azospirillum brasilense]|uniref:DUF3325 domain-containing protein n=1 Tax=Azospirillum brasilense TaxID=192 RepID=UPI000E691236|nr:DUF3325 domain-containing protein [Azospirillum brasilense]NUB27667.1 DUF3325 family protein [Azospirillum brasilense]NUB31448.1 DUF3325 family protein [Azospirillum brasilense]RIW03019.1 DUF3325 domain-containing protein [Azospirillum brasilense]
MIHLSSFILCLTGFAALAFAMDRPQHDLFGRSLPAPATASLRVGGAAALLGALGLLVSWQGWGLGLVMFSGHTSLGAGVVHGALIVRQRRAARPN